MKKIETKAAGARISSRSRAGMALQDILALLQDRHGGACADGDGGMYLAAVIPPLAVIAGGIDAPGFSERIQSWAEAYTPGLSDAQIRAILLAARERDAVGRLMMTAADLGALLELTTDERERLSIKQARPAGMTEAEFREYQDVRKLAKDQARRRSAGAKPRSESLAQSQPWLAQGISRATWHRHRAKEQAKPHGPIGTDFETRETDTREHITLTARSHLSHAVPKEADAASRADSTTRKRRRTRTTSGRPANDNRVLKPYRPKRGKRMGLVGSVNDNGGDD